MTAMTNMPLDEIVRLIDPALEVKRKLIPSSLQVYEVEREKNKYVLKIAKPQHSWAHKHIRNERDILQIAHNIPGITHMVQDYGSVNDNYAILKEYFEGCTVSPIGERSFMQSAGNMLKDTLDRLHSLGFAGLDVKLNNAIISPDGRDARIIDLGMYITASEAGQERFEAEVITDNIHLQEILSYVNAR